MSVPGFSAHLSIGRATATGAVRLAAAPSRADGITPQWFGHPCFPVGDNQACVDYCKSNYNARGGYCDGFTCRCIY